MPDPSPRRTARLALAALLTLVAAVWLWSALVEPPVGAPGPDVPDRDAGPRGAGTAPAAIDAREVTGEREPAVPAAPPAEPPTATLRVRLRGLHPQAPWTAALHLDVDGRDEAANQWLDHDARTNIDAEGCGSFAMPSWWPTATQRRGRIVAQDPNYLALAHRWEGDVDLAGELLLDVQVTASLAGRVVDARNAPVAAARICAFAIRSGEPVDEKLAETNSRADGSYRLVVPPGAPLLLLAAPMRPVTGSRLDTGTDGAVRDDGEARADLLPGAARAWGRVGTVETVPDIVLADAMPLSGRVRWTDGAPIALATVQAMPQQGTTFVVSDQTVLELHGDLAIWPLARTATDDEGAFVMPSAPGARVDVTLVRTEEAILLGDLPTHSAVAPQRVEIVVPRPVRLAAVRGGTAVPRAGIEVADERTLRTGATGEVDIVVRKPVRVRASHERMRSPWVDLDRGQAGGIVRLELAESLGEVSIEFEGAYRVRNTTIHWRSADDREGEEHLLRDDRSGPFRIFLEPGRYRLRAGPGGGERNGVYLLPVERDVEVAADPVRLVLPAVFGGTFVVMATDGNGLYVAGTCRVLDAEGRDLGGPFTVEAEGGRSQGPPGELMAGGPNAFAGILPPGEYELWFDFVGHGAMRHRTTIRPREAVEVRVRL